jgi:hypothetical protein
LLVAGRVHAAGLAADGLALSRVRLATRIRAGAPGVPGAEAMAVSNSDLGRLLAVLRAEADTAVSNGAGDETTPDGTTPDSATPDSVAPDGVALDGVALGRVPAELHPVGGQS